MLSDSEGAAVQARQVVMLQLAFFHVCDLAWLNSSCTQDTDIMSNLQRYVQCADDALISEYGNATDPGQFDAVLEMSPLQNIRQPNGTHQYPAMLITHGKSDKSQRNHSLM